MPINGVAPETVMVLTLTLSATTTENIILFVGIEVVNIKLLKLAEKEDITGPEVSDLVTVKETEEDEELLLTSVAEMVKVFNVEPKL